MKKLILKIALGIVLVLIVGLVVAAMFLGSIIKKAVETAAPPLTKTDVKLGSASLSILSGSGSLKNFVLGNPQGYTGDFAVKVGEVDLGVAPGSLFSDKVHIRQIRVVSPEIRIEGDLKKNNLFTIRDNLQSALGASGGAQPATSSGGQSGSAKKLQVDDFSVTGAKVYLKSALLGGKELTFTLPDIHLADLGAGPEGITGPDLANRLFAKVTEGVVAGATTQLAEQATKAAGDTIKNVTDQATKGIGDLFKKK